jgi:hypothetical protein
MSATLAPDGLDPDKYLELFPDWGLVEISVAEVRAMALQVERDPQPDDEHHVLVHGKKTGGVRRRLKAAATWVRRPSSS